MDRVIYTAMTGAKHTLERQAAVAHNLANAASTGYRTEMHRLRAVEVQTQAYHSRAFVVDASVATDFTEGPLQYSGRAYDIAIEGKGWLAVQSADGGEAYTRNGRFEITANGLLQTHNGHPVLGANGAPITIPPETEISIGRDGTISTVLATIGQQETVNIIEQLKLVNPPEQDLVRGEDGLFRLAGGGAAMVDPNVQVANGYLEGSNVNVVEQMVTMISLARQFEMQTRMIQTAETNDRAAVRVVSNN